MSAHKLRVRFSPLAEQDYEDILLYTLRTWGVRQKDRYKAILDRALAGLADYPEMAPVADELPPGYRGRHVEQHVIYYRIEGDTIWISRILHVRRDVSNVRLA